jgi:hypothetical protein
VLVSDGSSGWACVTPAAGTVYTGANFALSDQIASTTGCPSGEFAVGIDATGVLICAAGNAGTVTSVGGSGVVVSSGGATPSLSLSGCANGQVLEESGGVWTCTTPNAGTVTSVGATAGGGLVAGGSASAPTLGLISTCASGQVLEWNGSAWACTTPNAGTVTSVSEGSSTMSDTGTQGVVVNNSNPAAPSIGLNSRTCPTTGGVPGGVLHWNGSSWSCVTNGQIISANSLVKNDNFFVAPYSGNFDSSEANVAMVVPLTSCTLGNLYASVPGSSGNAKAGCSCDLAHVEAGTCTCTGGGTYWAVVVRVAGSDTSLGCIMQGAGIISCNDLTTGDATTVSAGQTLSFHWYQNTNPNKYVNISVGCYSE